MSPAAPCWKGGRLRAVRRGPGRGAWPVAGEGGRAVRARRRVAAGRTPSQSRQGLEPAAVPEPRRRGVAETRASGREKPG